MSAAQVLSFPDRTMRTDLSYLEKATAINLQFGSLPLSKKLPKDAVKTDTPDEDRVRASKKLLQCEEVKAIQSAQSDLRRWIYSRTLPSPFRAGILLMPNTLLAEADAQLTLGAREIERLGEALIAEYSRILEKEFEALGPNFNPGDYLSPEDIRSRLRVEWSYVVFGVPQNLPGNLYAREQDKARERLAEATDQIQQVLRAEMNELISHAVERLSGTREKDGKPLVFKNTLITNIREFLDVFKDRNITSDTELEALCDRARELLNGVDPQHLREQAPLRESVAAGFAAIKSELDGMMVPAGSRAISFDEDV